MRICVTGLYYALVWQVEGRLAVNRKAKPQESTIAIVETVCDHVITPFNDPDRHCIRQQGHRLSEPRHSHRTPRHLILAMVLSASAGGTIVGDSGLPLVTS